MIALGIEWTRVSGVTGVGKVDRSIAGEGHAVATVARRKNAVKHVDAARHRLDQIVRRADAHQVSWTFGRKHRRRFSDDLQHLLLRLAHGKSADRISIKIYGCESAGALRAHGQVVAPLHDAEQRVAISRTDFKSALAALGPAQ